MKLRTAWALACLFAFGCKNQPPEAYFFDEPYGNRLQRLRGYSLEDQYKIFRYGNDKIEPPLMDLAEPIAERGKAAIPFLSDKLNSTTEDITVRDILLIFETMARIKSYDVRSDTSLMRKLSLKVNEMKDERWRAVCLKGLQRIKDLR